MSSSKHQPPNLLKLPRQQYDLLKSGYYRDLPFEKAKGHINPYTNTKIQTWHDYELYGHCYVLKKKMEEYASELDKQYKEQNEQYKERNNQLQLSLKVAKCDIDHLKNSQKVRTRWLVFVVILCIVFSAIAFSRPSTAEYNSLSDQLTQSEQENKELRTSVSSSYTKGKSDGYSSGYSAGYDNGQKYSVNSSYSGFTFRENPEPISSDYIGNSNSKKFHLPTCGTLPDLENQISFSSREDAINSGYIPCKRCCP